jgi:hypothetical protein
MTDIPDITVEDVKDAYEGANGTEAMEQDYLACAEAFEETAGYMTEYEYTKDDEQYLSTLFVTLDVLRKAYGGDFEGLKSRYQ